ncbi:NUDIX domain-containing protein [Pseudoalteromonas luteoviolacea]|uniref:Nudix hydrolase domain-containing protein n=1 Tax=Pseudoalteromonas luteoviolacea H33 TaxID=1365251 RepID=A0A167AWK0_9GAMM|nr:NUDIX domain-containing protein [Pseudoalteromonas luteoviolacea]KZN45886.1 hypothetical protein N476_24770 [Pseudoalteromonas luteoviolacea H33]KZN76896.1 hypothetical protein N477_14060 [Pseudoalteromonas luteoviolacea H33-S]
MVKEQVQGVIVNVLRETEHTYEYLYLKRSGGKYKGHWWPVGGTCNPTESPLDCAIRELKEETNLNAFAIYPLGKKISHIDNISKLIGYVAFISAKQTVRLNYEHNDFKWMAVEKAYTFLPHYTHVYIKHIEDNFIKSKPQTSQNLL